MSLPCYLPSFYSQLDAKEKPELHWFKKIMQFYLKVPVAMKIMQFYLKVPAVKFIISTVCIVYLVY